MNCWPNEFVKVVEGGMKGRGVAMNRMPCVGKVKRSREKGGDLGDVTLAVKHIC